MIRFQRFILLATVVAAIIVCQPSTEAGGRKFDDLVKATAIATKAGADGKQSVTITLDIEKGWYIYANPVAGPKDYDDNRTQISVKAKDRAAAEFNYPAGNVKIDLDPKTKKEARYHIYQNQVVIQGKIQRSLGDASPLQVSISINVCNHETCLPPRTITVSVP